MLVAADGRLFMRFRDAVRLPLSRRFDMFSREHEITCWHYDVCTYGQPVDVFLTFGDCLLVGRRGAKGGRRANLWWCRRSEVVKDDSNAEEWWSGLRHWPLSCCDVPASCGLELWVMQYSRSVRVVWQSDLTWAIWGARPLKTNQFHDFDIKTINSLPGVHSRGL